MLKTKLVAVLVLAMTMPAFQSALAQDSGASKKAPEAEKMPGAYRLDFLVSELDDGKKINTRQYSMDLKSPDSNEIKIGTRVPVDTKEGEFQYLDVGTNVWCRLQDQQDEPSLGNTSVMLKVRAELSNFAMPDETTSKRPTIRQMKMESSTIAVVGKPLVIATADDPNSKRQFQLEVTVTKLR